MAGFSKCRPGCRFRLRKGDSAQVHRLLEEGSASIGFVGAALDQAAYRYQPVLEDKLVLVTANLPRFRAAGAGGDGAGPLEEPMLCREPGSGTRQRFDAYLERLGIQPPSSGWWPRSTSRKPSWVRWSPGWECRSVPPGGPGPGGAGSLLTFELEEEGFHRSLYLAVRRERELSPLELAFCHFVEEGGWERP